jgi:hypothetical protein
MAYAKLSTGELIDEVLNKIAEDVQGGDLTAVEELLKFAPRENLIAYLPEEGL